MPPGRLTSSGSVSKVRTLPVAPLWCDLGFFTTSRGNKAAANLRPKGDLLNWASESRVIKQLWNSSQNNNGIWIKFIQPGCCALRLKLAAAVSHGPPSKLLLHDELQDVGRCALWSIFKKEIFFIKFIFADIFADTNIWKLYDPEWFDYYLNCICWLWWRNLNENCLFPSVEVNDIGKCRKKSFSNQ